MAAVWTVERWSWYSSFHALKLASVGGFSPANSRNLASEFSFRGKREHALIAAQRVEPPCFAPLRVRTSGVFARSLQGALPGSFHRLPTIWISAAMSMRVMVSDFRRLY